jgi:hypothetical protein
MISDALLAIANKVGNITKRLHARPHYRRATHTKEVNTVFKSRALYRFAGLWCGLHSKRGRKPGALLGRLGTGMVKERASKSEGEVASFTEKIAGF